jgi:transposase
MNEEKWTLSRKELDRLTLIKMLDRKAIRQVEAARQLHVSVRHIRRLYRQYQVMGPPGLQSQRRGRPSNRRLPERLRERVLRLIRKLYSDFGPTLAQEKLVERDGVIVSVSTLRRWMIVESLYKPRKVRKGQIHPRRDRRERQGELVQLDGSHHHWFEKRGAPCVLLVFIDDATSDVLLMRMYPGETTEAYMDALRRYLANYGRMVTVYPDQDSIFKITKKELLYAPDLTQFGRILETLDIELICALSPEAKGRVERSFKTLQDRLVKELRLRGIQTIEAANDFLEVYRLEHNRRFAVAPCCMNDAHRPVRHSETELDLIFTFQEPRVLSRCLSLQYHNTTYQIIPNGPGLSLRRARVIVCEDPQHKITILYKGKPLPYTIIRKAVRQSQTASGKTINQQVDNALKKQKKSSAHKPPPDHPWRHMPIGNAALPMSPSGTSLMNPIPDISIER